jgi:hypothetical protein
MAEKKRKQKASSGVLPGSVVELRFRNPASEMEKMERELLVSLQSLVKKFHQDVATKGKSYGLNVKTQVYFQVLK